MTKYKIETENGREIIGIDKELEKGDKGFIINGDVIKVKEPNARLFRVVDQADKVEKEDVDQTYEIDEIEKNEEKQFILGRVLIPDRLDGENDVVRKEEIEKAAWRFMRNSHAPGYRHDAYAKDCYIVESYIAPTDFELNGEIVKQGTWLMGMKIENQEIWQQIKENKLKAYSIGGWADRVPISD